LHFKEESGSDGETEMEFGVQNRVAVDCRGKSGGLALWWRDGVDVSVRPWCQYYLDAKIKQGDIEWRLL
jgi:hypothetical protein